MLGYTVNLEPAFDTRDPVAEGRGEKEGPRSWEGVERVPSKVTSSQITDASHPSLGAHPSLGMPVDTDKALGSLHSNSRERWTDDCGSCQNINLSAVSSPEGNVSRAREHAQCRC